MPRSRRRWYASGWLREADVEGAAVGGDVDRAGAGHAETEALHVTPLFDVLKLRRIVERREHRVLWPDRGDAERWGHERPVHHDRGADAINARRAHDALVVDRHGLCAALPGGVDDVGQVRRVADRLVDVPRRD